jgi:hypothetical protein
MRHLASPAWVAAGCALIVATGALYLSAAAWNRRGEREAALTLTERELALPWSRQDEGTALDLFLVLANEAPETVRSVARWRHRELPPVAWIGRDKLRELGFRVDRDPADPDADEYYLHQFVRRTYVVVEYEGEGWRRWLSHREEQVRQLRLEVDAGTAERTKLEDAEALLALDRTMRSRLFPVDAGKDPGELRSRYPDRRRFAVLPAAIRPRVARPEGEPAVLTAEVHLLARRVHVPLALRDRLEPFLPEETGEEVEARERRTAVQGWPEPIPARYGATVAIGHRLEAWLVSVTPSADSGDRARR